MRLQNLARNLPSNLFKAAICALLPSKYSLQAYILYITPLEDEKCLYANAEGVGFEMRARSNYGLGDLRTPPAT